MHGLVVVTVALCTALAAPGGARQSGPATLAAGARVFIAPMEDGFDAYLKDAFQKKQVRLRATPLSPLTILGAHVAVKLGFTIVSVALLVALGRRLFPGALDVPLVSFAAAVVLSTLSILSLGFVIASVVPTARFAQPIGAALVYPMVVLSGVFFPLAGLPRGLRAVLYALPTTHAVALMQGVWDGTGWQWAHAAALVGVMAACAAVSARIFRWE
jgi:ABC-2 type transport system permease protein